MSDRKKLTRQQICQVRNALISAKGQADLYRDMYRWHQREAKRLQRILDQYTRKS